MLMHFRGDEPVDPTTASGYPVLVQLTEGSGDTTCHCFESRQELETWSTDRGHSMEIAALHAQIDRVRPYRGASEADLHVVRDKTVRRCRRAIDDINELADALGMHVSERPFQERLAAREYLDGPVADPLTLFEDFDQAGTWYHFPGAAYPDLRWFQSPTATDGGVEWRDWNDRARSYTISGAAVLYEHIWFEGSSRYLIGPPLGWGNLEGFDQMASSLSVL